MSSQRYFIELAFKGKQFNGWQIQPNAPSVQACIENELSKLLRIKTEVVGCGRTDAGVHATQFFAHFDNEKTFDNHQLSQLCFGLNNLLPPDISIYRIFSVPNDFHARYNAVERTYKYKITPIKNPFLQDLAWYYRGKLNLALMNESCQHLLGEHDFSSFCKVNTQVKTKICHVTYAKWEQEKDLIVFTITANRFLRNMVRAIVGTTMDVGREKINMAEFIEIVKSKNRANAGYSVPAHGLYLEKVCYPADYFI